MATLLHDLRIAIRGLAKRPGFTVVCLVSLALGIGGNCAVFTVLHGVLIRPLPYEEPDRLMVLSGTTPQRPRAGVSAPDFLDWRREARSLEGMAGFGSWAMRLTGEGTAELVEGGSVSRNFFEVLGITPALGRTFDPAAAPGEELSSVVLGHGLWQRRFGSDSAVIGRTVTLDGEPYTVIGVLPEGFRWVTRHSDFWVAGAHDVPRYVSPRLDSDVTAERSLRYFRAVGRLAPGTSREQAQTELSALMERLGRAHPETNEGYGALVEPLGELIVGDVRKHLWLLMGAVAFVLLIACANLAGLLLARASDRQAELAIRASQGATGGALARQLFTESVLLAITGGVLGLAAAAWGVRMLVQLLGDKLPRASEIAVTAPVLAFTFVLSVAVAILVSLLPALRASRLELGPLLSEGGNPTGGRRLLRLRSVLVAAEVALALVLATGAGLLLRTLVTLQSVELGFDGDGVMIAGAILPDTTYREPEEVVGFQRRLLDGLNGLPEVRSAALVVTVPFAGSSMRADVELEGAAAPPSSTDTPEARYEVISDRYFETLGIPVLKGRSLGPLDTADAEPVVVVNRLFADLHFPEGDVLGRRVAVDSGPERPWRTIVGVVANARHRSPEDPVKPEVYVPYQQKRSTYFNLVVRGHGAPMLLEGPVRQQVALLDPELPLFRVKPLSSLVAASVAERRFLVWLAGLFAVLALVLATVGVYGLTAYSVAQRTRELGIRMALGAERMRVLRETLGHGALIGGTGVVLGLLLAVMVARSIESLLFGVEPVDPLTLVVVAGLLMLATCAAAFIPARRAASVDPVEVMRQS